MARIVLTLSAWCISCCSKNTGLILQQELRLALKAHVHTTEVQQVVALKTLTLLEHFLPVIPNYKYEMHKPSHVWTDTESCKGKEQAPNRGVFSHDMKLIFFLSYFVQPQI